MVAPRRGPAAKNPLEIRAALFFSLAFVLILVLTNLARRYLGHAGLYALAAIMGVTDVDPFILGLAQGGPAATPLRLAATAIVLAAASNNVIKAIYAYAFADRATGRRSLLLLLGLAICGLIPLAWTKNDAIAFVGELRCLSPGVAALVDHENVTVRAVRNLASSGPENPVPPVVAVTPEHDESSVDRVSCCQNAYPGLGDWFHANHASHVGSERTQGAHLGSRLLQQITRQVDLVLTPAGVKSAGVGTPR